MSFLTPGGVFNTQVEDGAATRGGSVGVDFKKDLGDGWGFNGRGNIADYHHTFALFSGGDNITNLPVTQAGFLQSYGYSPSAYTGKFTYADSGAPLPAGYLLWGDRVQDRDRPLNTATGELNITKDLLLGDWSHHFTVGGFWGYTRARDYDITYSYIGDFDNAPKLVDVTVTNNATGAQTIVSRNGMVDAGLGYVNNYYDARRYAGYFADQMEFGNWVLDLGGRYESLTGDVRRELTSTYTTDTTANLSPLLSQVTWGNGHFLDATVNPTAWAVAGGVLYRLDPHSSLFLNASRGFFMPNLNSVQIDTNNDVQSFEAEIIKQVEGGYKYCGQHHFRVDLAVLHDLVKSSQRQSHQRPHSRQCAGRGGESDFHPFLRGGSGAQPALDRLPVLREQCDLRARHLHAIHSRGGLPRLRREFFNASAERDGELRTVLPAERIRCVDL
jgi:iron complex outermembrane receptor protein